MILNSKKKQHIAGVSLIELLITLLVLTIGITALIKFQATYFYYYDVAKQQSDAIDLARDTIEALRNYEVLNTTPGFTAYADIASSTTTVAGDNTTYTVTCTVTTNTNPDYKTVNVQVSWTDRRNIAKSITLTSIIAKIDPSNSGLIME